MTDKLFVVGDLHGEYQLLEQMLRHWNPEEETLVFLGDLADRGPQSKECFLKVKELVDGGQAVCLSGNHEVMLLDWLSHPQEKFGIYVRNGGHATLESLLYQGVVTEKSPEELAQLVWDQYGDLIAFLKELPLYYETDFAICVHAGINLDIEDWRQTDPAEFVWLREAFYNHPKEPEKLVVFGHTPLPYLHQQIDQTHLWYRRNKLAIDGGAAYEGALHGVVISEAGLEADYQIFHPSHRWQQR